MKRSSTFRIWIVETLSKRLLVRGVWTRCHSIEPFSGVEIRMEIDIGYGVEIDGNGEQFVKLLWIGLDLGKGHQPKTIR